MVTASFLGLLKVIFWFIVIYYSIRFLARIFAPIIIQQVVKKAGQNMYERQQEYYNQNNSQQQSYNNTSATAEKPKEKKQVGEYIDYEEIE